MIKELRIFFLLILKKITPKVAEPFTYNLFFKETPALNWLRIEQPSIRWSNFEPLIKNVLFFFLRRKGFKLFTNLFDVFEKQPTLPNLDFLL